jgi:DNA-binding NarL/FixJ family response regulator
MEHQTKRTRIIVLDRHALFRRGVVALLTDARPDWSCSDADSLDAMGTDLGMAGPALVLIDMAHPDLGVGEGLPGLIASHPDHIFVGLSDDDDRAAILACLTAGARGYILRVTHTAQFVRALETIVDGGVYAPVALTAPPRRLGPAATETRDTTPPLANLTERQRDVFNLLAEGCPTKTIARRLDLAVGTVKVHLAAIYRALGANSRLEAVAKAHRTYVTG